MLARGVNDFHAFAALNPLDTPTTVSATYTMVDSDAMILAKADGGPLTVFLLPAVGREGREVVVKKIDSSTNAVLIDADSTETIDGSTTTSLAVQHEGRHLKSDGTNWRALSAGGGAILQSGVYTPTLFNVANLAASTAYECQYMRVGNTVTVSGKVDVDPTLTATATQLGISLPIASNIGAAEDCAGVAFASTIAAQGAAILGDATNNRAEMNWVSGDITNQPMYFTFSYQAI